MARNKYRRDVAALGSGIFILSLDADFLASGPGHLRYMKEFYRRRKLDQYTEADPSRGEDRTVRAAGEAQR